jgi:hypothetical protein
MVDMGKSEGDPWLRGDILMGRSGKRSSSSPGVHVHDRRWRGWTGAAGIHRNPGRKKRMRRSLWWSQFDSLNGDEEVDDVELQDASAWRRMHCNGGVSSTMAAMVCGSFLAHELAEKNKKKGEELWRRRGRRLGFAGNLVGIKREGKVEVVLDDV